MDHQPVVTAVLFDLDGTLLPMDQNAFIHTYFGALARKVAPLGFAQEPFLASMWKGTGAMLQNDGTRTNREAFWDAFASVWGGRGSLARSCSGRLLWKRIQRRAHRGRESAARAGAA